MEKTSIKKRQKARTLVMQALYQWSMTHASAEEIELQFRMMNTPGAFDDAYFTMLLHGIMRDIDSIEKQFVEFLDRPLDELNPVERAVLRLGTYELMHRID
ncbi:MAG: transcription antitermination factor NusB, partial [Legionellaceae bacterium]|nr:transcription antitermination factor NusB [Legionellaceae bacterium]